MKKHLRKWLKRRQFSRLSGISHWVGRAFSNHFTSNQVTLIGLALCVPIYLFFLWDTLFLGAVLLTISLLTDFVDGALARYQQGDKRVMTLEEERRLTVLQRVNYRGVTQLGRSLDPVVDKVRFFCVLYPLGLGFVSLRLIIGLTLVALILTAMRPIKQMLKLDDVGSNRFGKYKVIMEVFAMATLVLLPGGQYQPINVVLANITFGMALILGLLSLSGHLFTGYLARLKQERKAKKARKKAMKAFRVSVSRPV